MKLLYAKKKKFASDAIIALVFVGVAATKHRLPDTNYKTKLQNKATKHRLPDTLAVSIKRAHI